MSSPKHARDADESAPSEKRRKHKQDTLSPTPVNLQGVQMVVTEDEDGDHVTIKWGDHEEEWDYPTHRAFILSQSTCLVEGSATSQDDTPSPCRDVKDSKLVMVPDNETTEDSNFRFYCFPNALFQDNWTKLIQDLQSGSKDGDELANIVYGRVSDADAEAAAHIVVQHAIWEAHRLPMEGKYTLQDGVTFDFVSIGH